MDNVYNKILNNCFKLNKKVVDVELSMEWGGG